MLLFSHHTRTAVDLTGVFDEPHDRYVYINEAEFENLATFVHERGRVRATEVAKWIGDLVVGGEKTRPWRIKSTKFMVVICTVTRNKLPDKRFSNMNSSPLTRLLMTTYQKVQGLTQEQSSFQLLSYLCNGNDWIKKRSRSATISVYAHTMIQGRFCRLLIPLAIT